MTRPSNPSPIGDAGIRASIAVLAALLALVAAACRPRAEERPPEDRPPVGPFECADRGPAAEPPVQPPPSPTADEGKGGADGPFFTSSLCPEGQVPRARGALPTVAKGNPLIGPLEGSAAAFFGEAKVTAERIAAAQRAFGEVYPHGPEGEGEAGLVPDPPGCDGIAYFGSCYYYGSAAYRRRADGGGMTMTVERPAYDGSGGPGHSLDEIAVQGGASDGDIVELGWNVSTSQYNNANPHLFVFHWIRGAPTCYDACGWVQYSAAYFPGMDLDALVGRAVYIGWVFYEGNWWAWFDNAWLGYFPGREWSGTYTASELIQWFGEVASANGIPPITDMGNGRLPADPAAARNATLCDVDAAAWVCWYRDRQSWGATFPAYYDVDRTGFGETRYGGPGG